MVADWTYLIRPQLETYGMSYVTLIPYLRNALQRILAVGLRLEEDWERAKARTVQTLGAAPVNAVLVPVKQTPNLTPKDREAAAHLLARLRQVEDTPAPSSSTAHSLSSATVPSRANAPEAADKDADSDPRTPLADLISRHSKGALTGSVVAGKIRPDIKRPAAAPTHDFSTSRDIFLFQPVWESLKFHRSDADLQLVGRLFGTSETMPPSITPEHNVVCRKGICRVYAAMLREEQREKERQEREKARAEAKAKREKAQRKKDRNPPFGFKPLPSSESRFPTSLTLESPPPAPPSGRARAVVRCSCAPSAPQTRRAAACAVSVSVRPEANARAPSARRACAVPAPVSCPGSQRPCHPTASRGDGEGDEWDSASEVGGERMG
ncbi:hypothetical protein NUW54_g13621 [Trametes sanguinea]|uniref:Uncharacterized protein n=1 Tax=Trametes sanguinea TaxID=158606 RepID=A0ACC1MJ65_9APHY|nr:hypothetical protein NUW54_g13621 [Trametes sanguinea]